MPNKASLFVSKDFPSSLAQDIGKSFETNKDASFGIRDGLFVYSIIGVSSGRKQGPISTQELMDRWSITKEMAKSTILATTQRLIRSLIEPSLNKRFCTNDRMLRYDRIQCDIFMDTFFAAKELGPSVRGNTCAQLFVSDFGFIKVKPMKLKSEVPLAIKSFFKSVPDHL